MAAEDSDTTNPFLSSVTPWVNRKDWRSHLYAHPLRTVRWKSMSLEEREQLLVTHRRFHFPSSDSLRLAGALQSDVYAAITARDPRRPENIAASNSLLITAGLPIPNDHSLFHSAGGATVMGDSGVGKSSSLRAIMRALFPRQCIDYGSSLEAYGIARLLQISYLIIEFNEDGSAWTLITAICGAIDDIAGTSHQRSIKNARNAESALDDVIRILRAHNVFVIVFDELQKDSLRKRGRSPDLISYFKKLMNVGISVILSGHGSAFFRMQSNLQLMRRFSTMGVYELARGFGGKSKEWSAFVQGMMTYRVVDEVRDPKVVAAALTKHSGLTQGFLSQLWVAAQKVSLMRGGDSVTLTADDVLVAAASEEYASTRRIIAEMAPASGRASSFEDLTPVPISPVGHQGSGSGGGKPLAPAMRNVPDSVKDLARAKKRSEAKRRSTEEAERDMEALDEDDLRRLLQAGLSPDALGVGPQGTLEL